MTVPELSLLRKALAVLSVDLHEAGTRPCPTCDVLTAILGAPFGCLAYQARYQATSNPYLGLEPRSPLKRLDAIGDHI